MDIHIKPGAVLHAAGAQQTIPQDATPIEIAGRLQTLAQLIRELHTEKKR